MSTISQTKAKQIFESLQQHIPGGVCSPARAFGQVDDDPLVIASSKGATLIDVDGKSYIDYVCGWGALMLGHSHPAVVAAITEQLSKGHCYVNSFELELKMAQLIVQQMPSIEKLRFVSSGTEATMSAIRVARAYAKKNLLVKFDGNYHGHSDPLLIKAGSAHTGIVDSKGVPPQDTISLPFNDCEALQALFDQRGNEVGVVIIEPIAGNMGVIPSTDEFIQLLQKLTTQYGAVLIFDEVMSGFRAHLGGAQAIYNVVPDMTCLGKIIGGGLPCAAFGGRKEIMDLLAPIGDVYQAGTLSSNPLALASGYATLQELCKPGVFDSISAKAKRIVDAVSSRVCTSQVGAMFTLFWGVDEVRNFEQSKQQDKELFKCYFGHCLSKGIYMPQSPFESAFVSLAHTNEHIDYTIETILNFLG